MTLPVVTEPASEPGGSLESPAVRRVLKSRRSNRASSRADLPDVRVDELSERNTELVAKKFQLVSFVDAGVPIQEALARVGIHYSPRAVRQIVSRYHQDGFLALV